MKKFSRIVLILSLTLPFLFSCVKGEDKYPGLSSVSFAPTDEVFANPERGFYMPQEVFNVSTSGFTKDVVAANRRQGRSIYLLEFHLTDYVNGPIADDYLQTIRVKFQSLRDNGAKCILRFCYSNGYSEKDKPWDATPDQVIAHIAQVKPLIQEFGDIIMVVQAGFIGSWGEWYYTENFKKDPDRKRVVDALLDAVPENRQIQLRTPAFKMGLYGFGLADTLTRETAHQNTVKARLGGHNDCYLATASDQGTYKGANDRSYWAAESPYVFMGGESCQVSEFCHCEPVEGNRQARGAMADLAMNHYTYLNISYHTGVLGRWRTEGCFDEINRRLGYRYVMDKCFYTKEPAAGQNFRVVLKLHNEGFAPAINPRGAYLVLQDASGKLLKSYPLESDPRYWMPGEKITIDQTITLPEGISGNLTLSLNLPDPCESISANPMYSIRMANEGIWDETTGYNTLFSFNI